MTWLQQNIVASKQNYKHMWGTTPEKIVQINPIADP